ncbi:MAG: HAMP domain-containing sensor histidine kinase [Bacillota bacterium]|nr:HAMP domain-containing sensor histidine kinase [Bacillota bacterium]
MNIRKRLILTNSITIILPIVFTFIISFVYIIVSTSFFNNDLSTDNFNKILDIKYELINTSSSILKQNPDAVEQDEFQKNIKEKLSKFNGEAVILKNDNIIFSTINVSKFDVEKCLSFDNKLSKNKIIINDKSYTASIIPLAFKNGDKGNVILFAPIISNQNSIEKFAAMIISVFILSFIITNVIMSYLLSKRIIKPVKALKNAAAEISSGNLEFEIMEDGDKEICDLCRDFEKMRVQLKDSVNMKMKYDDNRRMLVSSISHDLKTPITSIKGYVEGILDGIANTPEKQEDYLNTIYSKAELMDVMIDDLLLYSKLDLNQIPFKYEKTDIVKYFEYCIFESSEELAKDNIKIHMENGLKNENYVIIDRERMRRVIMNIINNAHKYMDKDQGEIIISLRETNLSIIIEIRDNGAGISEEDVNKIFDRFYRGDAARSETKGSGLGLAIAKQIVEGHKGKIWALSHGNEGTSILISLAKAQ